jgi:hypothetical protein
MELCRENWTSFSIPVNGCPRIFTFSRIPIIHCPGPMTLPDGNISVGGGAGIYRSGTSGTIHIN